MALSEISSVIIAFADNTQNNEKSVSKVYKINLTFDQLDKETQKKLERADNFILSNNNNVLITYRKVGINEFSQRAIALNFQFN